LLAIICVGTVYFPAIPQVSWGHKRAHESITVAEYVLKTLKFCQSITQPTGNTSIQ